VAGLARNAGGACDALSQTIAAMGSSSMGGEGMVRGGATYKGREGKGGREGEGAYLQGEGGKRTVA